MKVCYRCRVSKLLDEFNRSPRMTDGRHSYCRECTRAYYRENREKHLKNVLSRNRRILLDSRQRVWDYLLLNPCVDCGEADPRVLDFDHVRGKKIKCISTMVSQCLSWQTISREIEKCEVRCANCHRRKSASQFGWYKYALVSPLSSKQMKG